MREAFQSFLREASNRDLSWYFAYGSNMDSERLEERVGRKGVAWTTGVVFDYELVFNKIAGDGSGYANIQPKEGEITHGVLYALYEYELWRLDRCEGVPNHYRRIVLPVKTSGGLIEAFCYIAAEGMTREGLRPHRSYLKLLIRGAEEHHLPQEYIEKLKRTRCLEDAE
ncbi:MAG: gamma-glutamylcyclotransferase family protein [Atribacterota bacterium]